MGLLSLLNVSDNDHRFQVDLSKWYSHITSHQQFPHSSRSKVGQVRLFTLLLNTQVTLFLNQSFVWFIAFGAFCALQEASENAWKVLLLQLLVGLLPMVLHCGR